MKRQSVRSCLAGLCVLLLATSGFSEERAGKGEISPQQKEMIAKMEAYSAPNEHHALLGSMAGTWKANVEHRMSLDLPAEISEGTSENVMVHGGRFLEQSYRGEMGGKPFQGKGIIGYDNVLKKFQGIWYDSIGTGIMTSTSSYDPVKKVFSEEGHFSCPMTMGQRRFRGVTTLLDADNYVYEMFMTDDSGKEFRTMRIQYARVR